MLYGKPVTTTERGSCSAIIGQLLVYFVANNWVKSHMAFPPRCWARQKMSFFSFVNTFINTSVSTPVYCVATVERMVSNGLLLGEPRAHSDLRSRGDVTVKMPIFSRFSPNDTMKTAKRGHGLITHLLVHRGD